VSDYKLDDRGWILAEDNDFYSNFCVQTSCEVHPASYPVDNGDPFPMSKVTLTTFSHTEVKNELELYILSSWRVHGGTRTALLLLSLSQEKVEIMSQGVNDSALQYPF
jgi:hypothetical protein